MTHMSLTLTLENGADRSLIHRMIENMKGVMSAKVTQYSDASEKVDAKTKEWIDTMRNLSNSVDPSLVDMTDDRTRYIMSK